MKYLFLSLMLLIVSCSSTTKEDVEIQKAYFDAKARQAEARAKGNNSLLNIECDGNCNFKKLQLANPYENPIVINRPKTTREVDSETAKTLIPGVIDGIGYIVGGMTIYKTVEAISRNAGTGNTEIHNNTAIYGENNDITASADAGKQRDTMTNSSIARDTISGDTITGNTESSNNTDTLTTSNSVTDNTSNTSTTSTSTNNTEQSYNQETVK